MLVSPHKNALGDSVDFVERTKGQQANSVVTPMLLKERLEPEMLESAGIETQKMFTKRIVRHNTKYA